MADKKTHLVFWPRVGGGRQGGLIYEARDYTPPGECSEPESEAHSYYAQRREHDEEERLRHLRSISPYSGAVVMPEKLFKVIIIGDPTVGKTSFVQRYVQNSFTKDYKGTVGVDFALKIIQYSEQQTVKLQLWDIAGQERFTWMTRVYYKDSHGCVIMFDLTNKNSFVNSLKWKRDLDSKCRLPDGSPIPCMLLANKCDLPHRQVDQMQIETFYKEHNFTGWTETSVKEGLMVNDSMRFLVDVMMRQHGMRGLDLESLKLSGPSTPPPARRCSC